MTKANSLPRPVLFLVLAGLLIATGCGGAPAVQGTPQPPTIFVTVVVTQVVATSAATETPVPPTPTPFPTLTPVWDPSTLPIYFPLQGCVASRLKDGDFAVATSTGGLSGVYPSKDLPFAPKLRDFAAGELFYITKGPWCAQNMMMWQALDTAGNEVFITEGNGDFYWLFPAPPWITATPPKPNK